MYRRNCLSKRGYKPRTIVEISWAS